MLDTVGTLAAHSACMSTLSTQEAPLTERKERIPVKVTSAEKRKFEKLAEQRHTTISELIRQLLHREADQKAQSAA